MIALGLRLDWVGSEALSWRDLYVIVRQCPPQSATGRSVDPEASQWGLTEQLLALVADYQAWLMWAKTEDGAKNRNRPKPIQRPGVEPDEDRQTFGSDPVPLDELDEFLGWASRRVEQERRALPLRDSRGRFVKRQ